MINDLGITLEIAEEHSLSANFSPNDIDASQDLRDRITAGDLVALDPLDGVTPLSTLQSIEMVDQSNSPNFRIFGGELNQLDDVVVSPSLDDVLQYNGSDWVNVPAASVGGGGSFALSWRFSTSTGASDPGNKTFRYNNATLASVTQIYVNDTSNNSVDASTLLNALTAGNKVYIQQTDNADSSILFTVVSVADNTGWFTINVTVDADGGILHGNNKVCAWVLMYGAGASAADELVKISANDTTAGYLNGKLVAATGISLTENNDGSNETLTVGPANDLAALEALATTGLPARTGSETWVLRSLTQPAAGITITNADGVAGNPTFALANDLLAVENLAATGIATRTAANTWTTRTITGTAGNIVLSNGNGVSGNPTINLATAGTAGTYSRVTTDAFGRVTSGININPIAGGGTNLATTPTNGQLLIGNGTGYTLAGLTAGTGINITPAAGSITISATNNGTVTSVAATQPAAGITITGSPITTSGTLTFNLANDLAALEGLATTGIPARTAADTWAVRTITAGTGIGVTDGGGVAGNPTINLNASLTNLNDVTITAPTTGDILQYNGSNFVNVVSPFSDMASVTVGLTASQAIPLTFTNVLWPTTHVENNIAIIEHSNTNTDRILIKETGLYLIAFSISFDADAGEEAILAQVVINDATVVPGSLRQASEDDEINDLSNTITATLTAGTYISLQVSASGTGNLLHSSSTFMVTRAKGAKGDKGDTGTIGDLAAVQARRTTVLNNIPLAWVDLNFDATDFQNQSTVIEHLAPGTPDQIQVKEAGTYEIYYFLSADDEVQGRVRVNDTTVLPGSTQQSGDPTDANNVVTPLSVKVYATLAANDILTVQIQAATTAENLFVDALFLVKKLEGAQGPAGQDGSGTTFNVQDEGITVTGGPHGTLNFVGAGVTATNAGSGVATVTIPGAITKKMFLAHNGAVTQVPTAVASTALFNTSIRSDSIFSYAAGVVTINKTAWFRLTTEITMDATGGTRSVGEIQLRQNGSPITGTLSYIYCRTNGGAGLSTSSVTWLVNNTSGGTVSVAIRENAGGVTTVAAACRFLIEEVDDPS